MIRQRKAFTLAETLVGVAIAAVLGLFITKLMTNAQSQAAKARCKGQLRQELQIVSKYLQRDIESSRVILEKDKDGKKQYKSTLKPGTSPLLTMEIPKKLNDQTGENTDNNSLFVYSGDNENAADDDLYIEVKYSLSSDGTLTRTADGSNHKIANNVKDILFNNEKVKVNGENIEVSYSGRVQLTIKLEAKPDGSNELITLEEPLGISIRQLRNKINVGANDKKIDNHWKQRINPEDY